MRRPVPLLILVLTLGTPAIGSDHGYTGPALIARYDGPVVIDNSQYRYTGTDMLVFSTAEHLKTTYPNLLPLRSAIDTWAARLGIHPRVLSAVAHDYFAGSLVYGDRMDKNAVVQLAGALDLVFSEQSPHSLAASRAAKATAEAFGFELQISPALAEHRHTAAATASPPPLFDYFQPPWEIGDTWAGGGAHGNSHNALDFWGRWVPWGGDTTPYWVAAMQEGVARVWSSCSVSVIHPNGWVTFYYHLDNVQVTNDASVQRNDRLANYADNLEQATCDGGWSTGPHVHMSVKYNDAPISVDQSNIDFTVFSHHAGVGDYDTDCSRSWYTHDTVGTVCPNSDQLLNNTPDLVVIFADGFESGTTSAWANP